MGRRRIVVGGEEWHYRVGPGFTRLWDPAGKHRAVPTHEVKGITPDTFERGQWKQTGDGQVTPADVRRFIESGAGLLTCCECRAMARVMWDRCDICGGDLCGECMDPQHHKRDCVDMEEAARCPECRSLSCPGPGDCDYEEMVARKLMGDPAVSEGAA